MATNGYVRCCARERLLSSYGRLRTGERDCGPAMASDNWGTFDECLSSTTRYELAGGSRRVMLSKWVNDARAVVEGSDRPQAVGGNRHHAHKGTARATNHREDHVPLQPVPVLGKGPWTAGAVEIGSYGPDI